MTFIITALAVWTVTNLLINERGPFDVFGHLRDVVGVSYDEMSRPVGSNELAKMLICPYCLSLWVALATALIYYPSEWVLHTVALSGGAMVIERWVNG